MGTDSLETLDRDRRNKQNPGDTFVSNTHTLPTADNGIIQNQSFYSTAPKESLQSKMAMTKSAFDTGFNKRMENNNNLSM